MEPAPVARVVAERVRRLRQQQGWTAQQLADMCADAGLHWLTRGTIAKIESGVRQSVTAEEVAVLARVLGVTATELLAPEPRSGEHSERRGAPQAQSDEATARRRQLGRALRQARNQARNGAGLTQSAVAELLGCGQAKINKIERTLVVISMSELNRLIDIYRIPAEKAAKLRDLAELDQRSLPQRRYSLEMSAYTELIDLEPDASEILCWHSERIPGPLQCDSYILAQHGNNPGENVVELLRSRRARAQIFSAPAPPTYRAILSESSLYRMPGGRSTELFLEQAGYLMALMTRYKHLTLQILSFDADIPFVESDFEILYFTEDTFVDFAYTETPAGSRKFKRLNDLNKFREHWNQLHKAALSRDDSAKFLESLLKSREDSLLE